MQKTRLVSCARLTRLRGRSRFGVAKARIHRPSQKVFEEDGLPGQARQ
jgi:hypothetical protein